MGDGVVGREEVHGGGRHHDLLQHEVRLHPQVGAVEAPRRDVRAERELRECEGATLTASQGEHCRGALQPRLRPLRGHGDARARGARGGEKHDGELHSSRFVRISAP